MWEYKVISNPPGLNITDDQLLTQWGKQGWELVSVRNDESEGRLGRTNRTVYYYFKREIKPK